MNPNKHRKPKLVYHKGKQKKAEPLNISLLNTKYSTKQSFLTKTEQTEQ